MRRAMALALALSSSVVMAGPMSLYRAYSAGGSDHFYTASLDEMFHAVGSGYSYEGVAGNCLSTPEAGTVPLYRLYSGRAIDHFYTTSWQERDIAVAGGWYQDEGVACYLYPQQQAGTCPFYRLWNGTDHFYTQSWQEALYAIHVGYGYEGVAGYLFPASGSCPN
jgi:hypothetical protein